MSTNDTHIIQVVKAAARGEAWACSHIVQQFGQSVFSLLHRMTGNTLDAEELTQDTLIRALQQIDSYDPDRATFSTWLKRIAYHLALNHLRHPSLPLVPMEEEETTIQTEANQEMVRLFQQPDDTRVEQLKAAIQQLSGEEQTLINLFYYDELPISDIAYMMQSTSGAVTVRLHRIRQKLHNTIQHLQAL